MRWNEIITILCCSTAYHQWSNIKPLLWRGTTIVSVVIFVFIYALCEYYIGIGNDWRDVTWLRNYIYISEIRLKLYFYQSMRYILDNCLGFNVFPSEKKILSGMKVGGDQWFVYSSIEMLRSKDFCEYMIRIWNNSILFVHSSTLDDEQLLLRLLCLSPHLIEHIPRKWLANRDFILRASISNRKIPHTMSILKLDQYLPNKHEYTRKIEEINKFIDE